MKSKKELSLLPKIFSKAEIFQNQQDLYLPDLTALAACPLSQSITRRPRILPLLDFWFD